MQINLDFNASTRKLCFIVLFILDLFTNYQALFYITGYQEGDEPRFSEIKDLVQMTHQNMKTLIVSDYGNNCLRQLRKSANRTSSAFAGKCRYSGDVLGRRSNAKFSGPAGLIASGTFIYVADSNNKKIKQVSTVEDLVKTIYQSETFVLSDIAFGLKKDEFYALANYGVLHLYKGAEAWVVGGGCHTSTYTRPKTTLFSQTTFHGPKRLAMFNNETLLVTDQYSLLSIDQRQQQVTTICPGKFYMITTNALTIQNIQQDTIYGCFSIRYTSIP